MRNVKLTRENFRMDEIWTQGKVTGIKVTLSYSVDGVPISVTDAWSVPEDEHMWAEEWYEVKREMAPRVAQRAIEETNLEFQMFSSITDYINTLPTE